MGRRCNEQQSEGGQQCGVPTISSDAASHKLRNRRADLAHSALVYVEVLRDLVAIVAADNAPETRTVYVVVAALGVIGVVLVILAIWLIKQTRPDPQLLAPLERMNDRAWRKQEPAQMRRDLDEVRPADARPVVRGQDVPEADDEFAQSRPALATFDDLQAQLAAEARRGPSANSGLGADPLLPAPSVAEPGTDAAKNGAADTSDIADELDDTDGVPRPTATTDDDVADGTVTHTAGGSAEIAALVAPAVGRVADDMDDDSPTEDAESASTDSAD